MEDQYITFKPEGKTELKMSIKEFQDLHPEINFYAFFSKYTQTSKKESMLINFADIPDEKLSQAIELLRGKKNVKLRINAKDKQRILDKNISFKNIDVDFRCDLVSEAQEDIISRFDIGKITISQNEKNITRVEINKYKILLRKLRKIVQEIPLDAPEKVKFKKIYTRLAKKLEYDYEIIEDREDLAEYQEKNILNSRNLVNSLLLGKCVCAGIAETLKQALSLVNIECLNCISKTVVDSENGKEEAHMYNLVKIDGKWYNADLTWDMKNIKKGNYPRYCLKSNEDFVNVKEEMRPFHIREEDASEVECDHNLELFKKEKLKKYIKNKLRTIKKVLIKANILRGKRSNIPLLPETSKDEVWRQSMKFEPIQSLKLKSEKTEEETLREVQEKNQLLNKNEQNNER